jgi:hypothetical protein
MKDINYKEEYAKLKAKYTALPDFTAFNHYMEVSFLSYDVYDTDMMARFFRRLCERRLEGFIGFLQNFIYPPQQMMILIEESKSLTDEQKEECSELLKKAMALYRTCTLMNYSFNEEEECNKITEIVEFLQNTQPFLDKIISHLKEEWEKITQDKPPDAKYIG